MEIRRIDVRPWRDNADSSPNANTPTGGPSVRIEVRYLKATQNMMANAVSRLIWLLSAPSILLIPFKINRDVDEMYGENMAMLNISAIVHRVA